MDQKIVNKILKIIRNKKLSEVEFLKQIKQYHESDIADAFEQLSLEEQKEFFYKLSIEDQAELLTFVENGEDYLERMDSSKAADIVEEMDADDAVDILEEIEETKRADILEKMEDEQREDVELIHSFDEDEIGSKITTNYIVIKKTFTIREAMKEMIRQASENDNIQNLFVTEDDGTYYGTVILKDLIIARENDNLLDIVKTSYPTLYAHERVEDVISELKDIDLDIIPVLAENNTILGVITSQDIIESAVDEMSDDYVKFAGISDEPDDDEHVLRSAARRFPWLSLLLIISTITSTILSGFDAIFTAIPALVLFQSWILNTSGNAGTQSLALTIRAIADDELDKKNFKKKFFNELLIGLINGFIVGLVGFIVAFLFLVISKNYVIENGTIINQVNASLVVFIALFIAIPFTTIAGILIPVLFKKMHLDPAVASGPLITTLADAGGVAIYYLVAGILFHILF